MHHACRRTGVAGAHRPTGISHRPTGISHRPTGISHRPTGISHRPTGISNRPTGISHPPTGILMGAPSSVPLGVPTSAPRPASRLRQTIGVRRFAGGSTGAPTRAPRPPRAAGAGASRGSTRSVPTVASRLVPSPAYRLLGALKTGTGQGCSLAL
eukprot:scaffold2321_cov87-Isochrysis_galbana.AAC.2